MKTGIISGILLLVLTAYIIIPVIPVFDYLIHKEYIAKNLCVNRDKPKSCCHGKCHMVKKLKKANPNTENDSKDTTKRIQYKDLDGFLLVWNRQSFLRKTNYNYLIYNTSKFQLLAIAAIFVPPKQMLPLV